MRRIGRGFHITWVAAGSPPGVAHLGKPNVQLDIPAGAQIQLAGGTHAYYLAVSAPALNRETARHGVRVLRLLQRGRCQALVLDLRLAEDADSFGLRWLAQLRHNAAQLGIRLQVRTSSKLGMILRLAGWSRETLGLPPLPP